MEVIFEVNKYDTKTIELIKSSGCVLNDEYQTNGLNGTEIVAIVVALIPAVKEIALAVWNRRSVTIKISNEYGSTELTARNLKEMEKLLDKYLEIEKKIEISEKDSKNGQ